ncbi:tetratricopeptide repeat protein [Amycolatopsis sp. NPDC004079]|uniref:ATP-binding protein n=1 Tax=Amycolatopsis sp. NPDC004079 TaxID=3154549 RepID=UPI0033B94935
MSETPEPDVNNWSNRSESARDFVQARDVCGGVHLHQASHRAAQVPRQLPIDVRGFVNRNNELERLDRWLSSDEEVDTAAVAVIAGTAGVGKTALAIRCAHRASHRFPDGQLYVNLRGYDPGAPLTADDALGHFLRALDVPASRISADVDAKAGLYRSLVADKRMLIVLDNAATVGQVRPLLPGTSGCRALITSRSRLPGLVAREGARRVALELLSDTESVALLRAVTVGYRTTDNPGDLAELARLCARLPLALRVAAERAAGRPAMPLADLIQDLRDESSLWEALSTEDDDDADAVRAVFAWSYRALPPAAARSFRLLGLHPGADFGLDAATALIGTTRRHARRLLDTLVGAHLLEDMGSSRYQFHDLMRAYAADQARHEEPAAEQDAALRRVLEWYLRASIASVDATGSRGGAFRVSLDPFDGEIPRTEFIDDRDAARWYERERANLMAATRTAAAVGLDRLAWRIPAVLMEINGSRDPLGGWLEVDSIALDAARRCGDRRGEAVIHWGLGVRNRLGQHLHEAEDHYRNAQELFDELGDQRGVAESLNGLGLTYLRSYRFDAARTEFERGLAITRQLDAPLLVAFLTGNIGGLHLRRGDLPEAERETRKAVATYRQLGNDSEEAFCLARLAEVLIEQRQFVEARESLQHAMAYAEANDNKLLEGLLLLHQGHLELEENSLDTALISSQHAVVLLRQFGYEVAAAEALQVVGKAYRQLDRLADAANFFRQSAEAQRQYGDRLHHATALDSLAEVLSLLGKPDQARQAWNEAQPLLTGIDGSRAARLRVQLEQRLSQG